MLKLYGTGTAPTFEQMMSSGKPLIEATAETIKKAMDEGFKGLTVQPDELFRERLTNDVYVFSGCKTYNELKEATNLLKTETGALKPFTTFLADIKKTYEDYNRTWLQAEYNHAVGSSRMAAKWQQYSSEPHFNLQYRTAGDEHVRASHAALDNTTLPPDDPFWDEYYPPNGWNCRCNVVQVEKWKYPESDSRNAQKEGEKATTHIDKNGRNRSAMFRFNPGKEGALFPEQHPYYTSAPRRKIEGWLKEELPVGSVQEAVSLSFEDAKTKITGILNDNLGIPPKSIEFSEKLSIQKVNLFANHLDKLLTEYKPTTVYNKNVRYQLKFKSTATANGSVTKMNDGTMLLDVNFGHKGDINRLNKADSKYFHKSQVDEKNVNISTLYHEFAHLITTENQHVRYYADDRLTDFGLKLERSKEIIH